ncbi:hypothetical protein GCM10027297_21700 [Parahaliea aestuarii]
MNFRWSPRLASRFGHFSYFAAEDEVPEFLERYAQRAFAGRQSREQLFRSWYRGYLRSAVLPFHRLIVKDPTAVLMADWVSDRFNAQVVVTTRHPCGFASSIVPLEWDLSLPRFTRQNKLVKDHLKPHLPAIRRAKGDPWKQAAAIWSMIHVVLLNQLAHRKDWIICDFETLCRDPENQVSHLCARLGLVADAPQRRIRKLATGDGQSDTGSTRKRTAEMPYIWQSRLSQAQIDAVLETVADFGLSPTLNHQGSSS